MGRYNRQRRAASKRRKQRAAARSRPTQPPSRVPRDEPRRAPAQSEDPPRPGGPPPEGAEERLDAALGDLWERGWTPTDLVHLVTRWLTPSHASIAAERALADGRRRAQREEPLHPRWLEQLAGLEQQATEAGALVDSVRLRFGVELLTVIARLPRIPSTLPRPGDVVNGLLSGARLDAGRLERVRALLAKAESTEFEEEAEAFTAKAQELIARYSIDEALLHAADDVGDPSVRRLLIDDPYADAKAVLFASVGDANHCETVYSPEFAWVTAFGYDRDLDAVELLSMSLLTQATSAMVRHGPRRDAAGRSRTRSFRRAFLLGFAQRIGERLRQARDGQVAATPGADGRLLPVRRRVRQRCVLPSRRRFLASPAARPRSATRPAGGRAGPPQNSRTSTSRPLACHKRERRLMYTTAI